MRTTALKMEEKRKQLAREYRTLTAKRSENNKAMNNGIVTYLQFVSIANDIQREFRNWRSRARRYVSDRFGSSFGYKIDEIDIYYGYIKR